MSQQPETTLPDFEVAAVFQRWTGVKPLCHNATQVNLQTSILSDKNIKLFTAARHFFD